MYRVRKNGIIYIIPNDELYQKYKNGEAIIDKYGRLINVQTHRVIKELEQRPDDRPVVVVKPKEAHPIADAVVDAVANQIGNVVHDALDLAFYEVLPHLWHTKIKPGIKSIKEYKNRGSKLRCEGIMEQHQNSKANTIVKNKQNSSSRKYTPMTQEQIHQEQRKVVYHYIELLKSLTNLQNAGIIDRESVIKQLTNTETIEQINRSISANPNLLEMTQNLELSRLLERDLFQSGEFIPIEIVEIETIALKNMEE